MLSRRTRSVLVAAGVVATLAVVLVVLLLPALVRGVAVRRLQAMTGRPVTVAGAEVNPFTRRIALTGVRVISPAPAPPLLDLSRVEIRVRVRPLLAGRLDPEDLVLVDPAVHLVRRADGTLSAEDVIAHWLARQAGRRVEATLAALSVARGRITVLDQSVVPARDWVMRDVVLEARDITTAADAGAGRASAHFALAGGTGDVEIERLTVSPFQAHARAALEDIEVAPFRTYVGSTIRLRGGRFSTRVELDYDAQGDLHAHGTGTVRDLALERRGQAPPFVSVPLLKLGARGVTYTGGALSIGEITLAADRATILDATAPRARPLDVRELRLALHDARVPAANHVALHEPRGSAARPGRVALTAVLPGGGRLSARGSADVAPIAADLGVEVRDLDASLAQVWLQAEALFVPTAGRAAAALSVRYDHASGLVLGGRAWVDALELAHAGAPERRVRDERVELTVADLVIDGAGPRLGTLALRGSPTIVEGTRRVRVPRVEVTATGGAWRVGPPTRVEARISLPRDGHVTALGEAHLGVPDARFDVTASNVDATLAARYASAPIDVEAGWIDARLAVAWAGALQVGGRATLRDFTWRRRGHGRPLVQHAALEAMLTDLVVRGDGMSAGRVVLEGAPVIVDDAASPSPRIETRHVRLAATDVTWPGRRPMRLEGTAEATDGSKARLTGTLHPGTLAADVRLALDSVDLTLVRAYLARARAYLPIDLQRGRAGGTVHVRHTPHAGVRIDAEGDVRGLALTVAEGSPLRAADDRLRFSVDGLVVKDGSVALAALVLDGTPRLGGRRDLTAPLGVHAQVRRLAWPDGPPAEVAFTATGPGMGTVEARGTFAPSTRVLDATVKADDAALEPFAALLPIDAALGGRVDARVRTVVQTDAVPRLTVRGDVALRDIRIGPADAAPVRIARIAIDRLVLEGRTVDATRIAIARPSVLIERRADGSFPLRAILTPSGAVDAGFVITTDEIAITGGDLRFIDRTETPLYSEEITRLSATLRDVSSDEQHRAGLIVQGIVGGGAALDLRGEVAPFATPFFLEVAGELKELAGQRATKVHYRIVGDEVTSTNQVVLHRLDAGPARDRAERMVGVPLGLVVALLTDARGDIRIARALGGEPGPPRASFGDSFRNALKTLVTGPARAISRLFRQDGDAADPDPVVFDPGSAALTVEAGKHLRRVAEMLRASPGVDLVLAPMVSAKDVAALRRQEVTARIQELQRREGLDDLEEAGRRLFQLTFPGEEPPKGLEAVVRALAAGVPRPGDEARVLAERRVGVVRSFLVEGAGIAPARLSEEPREPGGGGGAGRVRLLLKPAS